MPKHDPYAAIAIEDIIDTREFTDPLRPGDVYEFTFTVTTNGSVSLAQQREAGRLEERYLPKPVKGTDGKFVVGDDGKVIMRADELFPPVGGKQVAVTATLLDFISAFMSYETPRDGEEKWDEFQWAAYCVNYPTAFEHVVTWAHELKDRAIGAEKNA